MAATTARPLARRAATTAAAKATVARTTAAPKTAPKAKAKAKAQMGIGVLEDGCLGFFLGFSWGFYRRPFFSRVSSGFSRFLIWFSGF